MGVDYYGKTMVVVGPDGKKRSVPAPREQWIEIKGYTEAIVDERVFLKAQKRLDSTQERYSGRNARRHILTGIAVCGLCGGWISGNGGVEPHIYYRCNSRHSKYVRGDIEKDCRAPGIPVRWLDDLVWSAVLDMVRDPSGVIEDLELNFRTGGGDIGKEVERLRAEIRKREEEEVRLVSLYRRGTVRLDLVEDEMGSLAVSLEELRRRLADLEEQRQREENLGLVGDRIREYCARVADSLDSLDVDGKRALMFRLGITVRAVKRDAMITAEIDPGFMVKEDSTCCQP